MNATGNAQSGVSPRRRVLLVDDESDFRATTAVLLAELGFDVTECENGNRAVDVLASGGKYDIVLSDVVMPGLSGFELSRLIRKWRPRTPVVLVTGWPDAMDAAVEYGLVPLLKPFTSEQLERVLAESVPRAA